MSRSWNFTASAPACTERSTSSLASSTEPLWLMPISLMTKVGCPFPTSCRPTRKASLRLTATATRWPCSSSSGTWSTAPWKSSRISAGVAVAGALTAVVFAASEQGRERSTSGCSAIQRRTSPSVREPTRCPCSVTQKTIRALFAVIFSRARNTGSSA